MMVHYRWVKRMLDICLAVLLLVISTPIMLLAGLAIKLHSKGPILFKQARPGKSGRIFHIYKLRTMTVELNLEKGGGPDVHRITGIGAILRKTSIDELPQLFNILRGEMSFIGPRPLLVEYLEYYTPEQMRRHDVTPGISGWAQVNGRNSINWEDKFKLDVWYVDHASLRLDFKIIYMTIINVLRREGINSSSGNTMPAFVGSNHVQESIKLEEMGI